MTYFIITYFIIAVVLAIIFEAITDKIWGKFMGHLGRPPIYFTLILWPVEIIVIIAMICCTLIDKLNFNPFEYLGLKLRHLFIKESK